MGSSLTGGRRRIDVIANQNGSSGKQQAVELSIKLRDAARVAELVHGLERDDEIEAGANPPSRTQVSVDGLTAAASQKSPGLFVADLL